MSEMVRADHFDLDIRPAVASTERVTQPHFLLRFVGFLDVNRGKARRTAQSATACIRRLPRRASGAGCAVRGVPTTGRAA